MTDFGVPWSDPPVEGSDVIERKHISRAIDRTAHRSARLEEQIHESLERGIRNVSLAGTAVGQVNGLTVIPLSSGAPHRFPG